MSDVTVVQQRPDLDIQNDVQTIIVTYPPTAADRHQIQVSVTDGVVTISGHVKTPINRRYLLNRVPLVEGVRGLDETQLFDEETIRLEVGRLLPQGVIANVRYGTVVLTGTAPKDTTVDGVAQAVMRVPGVRRVVAQL